MRITITQAPTLAVTPLGEGPARVEIGLPGVLPPLAQAPLVSLHAGAWQPVQVGPGLVIDAGVLRMENPADQAGVAHWFTHTQNVAAAVWTVHHNLGRAPSVTVRDTAGDEIVGAVHFVDLDTLTITFSAATSGVAHIV